MEHLMWTGGVCVSGELLGTLLSQGVLLYGKLREVSGFTRYGCQHVALCWSQKAPQVVVA